MDEIKQKILGLLNKQGPKIPSMGFSDSNYHFPQIESMSINSKTAAESDRPADQEILESIEAAYFAIDKTYDICRFELAKLPETLDCDQIQRDFKNLKQQHQVVSKKVLQLILEHQSGCNSEFHQVLECLDQVKLTLAQCKLSRKHLKVASLQFRDCLELLANHRKRKLAQNLLNNLKTIKHLHNFDKRLQKHLNDEDYAGAIVELKKCYKLATQFRHFSCVAALTYKLQETLENTDAQLDRVLAQICYHFDTNRYSKLLQAYNLLEKSQLSIIDSLHVHYITAIYNSSFSVISSYVDSPEATPDSTSLKNPYKTLCQSVPHDSFIPCLVQLCKVLFKIVLSYHQLVKWHVKMQENDDPIDTTVNQRQEHNLTKIWDDVQRKVSSLLLNAELAHYKFDQFVQVLSVVHRLMQVGDEFCSSKSEDLQESIRKQSIAYFRNYHSQRLEELKIFLENEMWEICPVKATFNVLQLQEFKPLRGLMRNFKQKLNSSSQTTDCSSNHSMDGSSTIVGQYFLRYAHHGTPFDDCDRLNETLMEEDFLEMGCGEGSGYFSEEEDETDDEEEELRKSYVDELPQEVGVKKSENKMLITNTTLSVLRQMGKYLQMSRLLRSISYQIISCMNELFDFYLYSVHTFFTSDLTISSNALYSNELQMTLKKIDESLLKPRNFDETSEDNVAVVGRPHRSPLINLDDKEQLNGLSERIVGVESVIFLAKQYEDMQEFLEFLVPGTHKIMLQQFFKQNIASAKDLRKPIYMAVVAQAFDFRQILLSMTKINWEVKDVMSQHNSYIDLMLREVQIFTLRLQQINDKLSISAEVSKSLWENITHIITHTLVQGFSEAKKCSNGGRALMQLDFIQFVTKFEKISGLRPIPHREYVEAYVKAYYLPENELEKWIKEHTEYSSKHLYGLVCCACQSNKKIKQKLLQLIEDVEKDKVDR